jgi:hypothetical protein
MGRFTIEEACAVPRGALYAWYTDFSGQDADLMARYGSGSLIERNVERLDDRRFVLRQRIKVLGRTIPATIRIEKHPESLTYDAHLEFGQLAKQDRRYSFLEHGGGTLLRMEVEYTPLSRLVRFLDAIGFLRRLDMKESRATTVGYLRAAEAELIPAGPS